jgi:hypothetical protein
MLSQYFPEQPTPVTKEPGSHVAGGVSSEIDPRVSAVPGRHAIAVIMKISRYNKG